VVNIYGKRENKSSTLKHVSLDWNTNFHAQEIIMWPSPLATTNEVEEQQYAPHSMTFAPKQSYIFIPSFKISTQNYIMYRIQA
jgi:hypothetical protein